MGEVVGPRLYSCCNCRNHVALHDDIISKAFQDDDVHSRTSQIDSGEVLDGIITRSRGEIRHTNSPKITSSTQTPREMQPSYSPRVSQSSYSPHLHEVRVDRRSRSPGKGIEIKQTPSPGPSHLGDTSKGSSS